MVATISKRKQKNGAIRYMARVRRDGITRTRTFGTRGQADAWARSWESRIDDGEVFTDESQATTLFDALERYGREVSAGKRGKKQELDRIRALQRLEFANKKFSAVTGTIIAGYRDDRLAAGKSAYTVRNELALLSDVFNTARREWGMASLKNPVENIKRPPAPNGRNVRLIPADEEKLLPALREINPEYEIAVIVLIETAMRRSELFSLTRPNIDWTAGVAHLPKTKNGESRDVPLSDRAINALKRLPAPITGPLFRIKIGTLTTMFPRACKKAGIKGVRLHDLRHEATTRLVESGKFNMLEIAAITGHKTLSMLKRYSHPDAAKLAERLRA